MAVKARINGFELGTTFWGKRPYIKNPATGETFYPDRNTLLRFEAVSLELSRRSITQAQRDAAMAYNTLRMMGAAMHPGAYPTEKYLTDPIEKFVDEALLTFDPLPQDGPFDDTIFVGSGFVLKRTDGIVPNDDLAIFDDEQRRDFKVAPESALFLRETLLSLADLRASDSASSDPEHTFQCAQRHILEWFCRYHSGDRQYKMLATGEPMTAALVAYKRAIRDTDPSRTQ